MKRSGILLAIVFGAALVASGPAPAAEVACMYNSSLNPCVWYPGYASATARQALGETGPLMTGRSVAVSGVAGSPVPGGMAGPGNYCATAVKTCLLREPGWLGTGCSCRVSGGHAQGFVQ
jgi:hypothetical protein